MGKVKNSAATSCTFAFTRPSEGILLLTFSGAWTTAGTLPPSTDIDKAFSSEPGISRISFETGGLTHWDSIFLTFLNKIINCGKKSSGTS